jgi:hypothetical protein
MKWQQHVKLITLISAFVLYPPTQSYSSDLPLPKMDSASVFPPKEFAIFKNKVFFTLSKNWRLGFENHQASMTTFEFIPEQNNLNEWTEMICLQGFKGTGAFASPETFLDAIVKSYQHHCEGKLIYTKLGDTLVDGQVAFHGLVACSRLPNLHQGVSIQDMFKSPLQGEVGYFSVARIGDDLLMLHKSMRGASFSQSNIPLTKENYAEFITELNTLTLDVSDE